MVMSGIDQFGEFIRIVYAMPTEARKALLALMEWKAAK